MKEAENDRENLKNDDNNVSDEECRPWLGDSDETVCSICNHLRKD